MTMLMTTVDTCSLDFTSSSRCDVYELDERINEELMPMIAIDNYGENAFKTLRWMNQHMQGAFRSCGLGCTVSDMKINGCNFRFDSTSRRNGVLTMQVSPRYGMTNISIETRDERVGFSYLADALDWWLGNIELEDLEQEDYHEITDEEKEATEQDARDAYEFERYKSVLGFLK